MSKDKAEYEMNDYYVQVWFSNPPAFQLKNRALQQ
jgi:hypothetical protein